MKERVTIPMICPHSHIIRRVCITKVVRACMHGYSIVRPHQNHFKVGTSHKQ